MITHEHLLEILTYDSQTGNLLWKVPRPRIQVGDVCGTLHHKGYIHIELCGKHYSAHRLVWFYKTGKWPEQFIDHINGCRSDNRFENLREATRGQNRANSNHNNMNGLKGVCYRPKLKKNPWVAQITHNKTVIYLGCYPTKEIAHSVYCDAAKKLHGEFFHG